MLNVAQSLSLLARREGIRIDSSALNDANQQGRFNDINDMGRFFREYGFNLRTLNVDSNYAQDSRTVPSSILLEDGNTLCVLSPVEPSEDGLQVAVIHPENPGILDKVPLEGLIHKSNGQAIILESIRDSERIRFFDRAAFMSLFTEKPWATALLVVMSLMMAFLGLTPIIYLQIALDKVIGYGATSTFGVLTVCTILSIIAVYFLGRFRDDILDYFGAEMEARLNIPITEKSVSAAQEKRIEPDVSLAAQSAIDKLRALLVGKLVKNILDLSGVILLTPVLFLYSPIVATLVLIYCLVATFVNASEANRAKHVRKEFDKTIRARASAANEIMRAGNALSSFDIDIRQNKEWLTFTDDSCRKRSKVFEVDSASAQKTAMFQSGLTILIIFSGVELVLMGYLTPGSLIALNLLAARILSPLLRFGSLAGDTQHIKDATSQVNAVLSLPYRAKAPGLRSSITGNIIFEQVEITGDDDNHIKNFSLNVEAGKRVALLSKDDLSAFTLCQSLDNPNHIKNGRILLDDIEIRRIDSRWLSKRILQVDNKPQFFEGSLSDNIHGMHPDTDPRDIDAIIGAMGLADNPEIISDGLGTLISSTGTPLSYTSKVQLAIARALCSMPSILVIKGALDPLPINVAAKILQTVDQRLGGGTLILSTVRSDIAKMLDDVFLISENESKTLAEDKNQSDIKKVGAA